MSTIQDGWLQQARDLHSRAIVVDTHCDTTLRLEKPGFDLSQRQQDGHVDTPRLREGGVSAIFFAVWAPAADGDGVSPGAMEANARAQFAKIAAAVRANEKDLAPARSAAEVRQAKREGRIAVLTAVEGGHLIEDSLDTLRAYRELGAAYLTLTHADHTNWADSSGVHESLAPRHGGLTEFGREVVRELNRLGMMVDVSHVSDETFHDVVETSTAPVVATHSSCRAVADHRRNLSDEMMKTLAATGGVVQINFAAAFLDPDFPTPAPEALQQWVASGCPPARPAPDPVTPLDCLVNHFDHALQLIGPDHVGIGSDFDGTPDLPAGMEDCSKLPYLTAALLARGYTEPDLTKVLGANVLRVMEACVDVAAELSRTK